MVQIMLEDKGENSAGEIDKESTPRGHRRGHHRSDNGNRSGTTVHGQSHETLSWLCFSGDASGALFSAPVFLQSEPDWVHASPRVGWVRPRSTQDVPYVTAEITRRSLSVGLSCIIAFLSRSHCKSTGLFYNPASEG